MKREGKRERQNQGENRGEAEGGETTRDGVQRHLDITSVG